MAGGGWLEDTILMKTQASVWTWTLDFDLRFVKTQIFKTGADLSMGEVGSRPGPPHFRGPAQIEDNLEFSLLEHLGP